MTIRLRSLRGHQLATTTVNGAMGCSGVEEGDALIADSSNPHGNWFTGDEDVYSIFMTMHPSNDQEFALGFENKTYAQCYMIFEELGAINQQWSETGLAQLIAHPSLLNQVTDYLPTHARTDACGP